MAKVSPSKKIWITGAGSGIGRSLALQFAAAGHQVLITGRHLSKLVSVANHFPDAITALTWDVTDDASCHLMGQAIDEHLGGLDIAILNAGHCEYVEGGELDSDLFRRVYDVNVFGTVNSIAVAMPRLKQSAAVSGRKGQIVGIASLSAIVGFPRAEAYGSSKAAVNYLLESLRLDLSNESVDVTVVNPGFVETPMIGNNDFPMPFIMSADKAAEKIIIGIDARKFKVQFPRRLYSILAIVAAFPALWYRANRKALVAKK